MHLQAGTSRHRHAQAGTDWQAQAGSRASSHREVQAAPGSERAASAASVTISSTNSVAWNDPCIPCTQNPHFSVVARISCQHKIALNDTCILIIKQGLSQRRDPCIKLDVVPCCVVAEDALCCVVAPPCSLPYRSIARLGARLDLQRLRPQPAAHHDDDEADDEDDDDDDDDDDELS